MATAACARPGGLNTARQALAADRFFPGTCAWSFEDWPDVFYPHSLPRNRWLEFCARHFPAVEMDSSFYHVPSARMVEHWSEMTAPGFRFCPKPPKTLSHEKRLADPGPEIFMPRQLADESGPRLLEDHGVAWVWADTHPPGEEKRAGFGFLPVTAPHPYVRLLGDFRTKYGRDGRETHRYGKMLWPRDAALEHWAIQLRHHARAEAIYVFANNRHEGMAVETARRLADQAGRPLPPSPADGAGGQLELFGGGPRG